MSCWGSKTVPLFEFKLEHVETYDDGNGPKVPPFHSKLELFVRVWKWEFEVTASKSRRSGFVWNAVSDRPHHRRTGCFNVPHVGWFDWSLDQYPTRQYSGDFTENLDLDRSYYTGGK